MIKKVLIFFLLALIGVNAQKKDTLNYTKDQINQLLDKIDQSYSKSQVDALLQQKADYQYLLNEVNRLEQLIQGVQPTYPLPVTNLSASVGHTDVTLTWTNPTNFDSIRIERSSELTETYITIAYVTTNTYTDTGLTSNMTYSYRLRVYFNEEASSPEYVAAIPNDKVWYVNKNASGLNNGTSWDNAWTSFANVNWNAMQDGDTLYISGGSDSTVYNEAIGTVGKSNITITRGKSAGYNGRVIIKAPVTGSGTAVQVLGKSNVKITQLEFHNWGSNIYLNGTINKFYFDNNKIINSYGGFLTTGGGVDTTSPKRNIWITNNYITTANWSTGQCEFSFYGTKNVYVIGNVIINSNNNPNPHDDFAQGDGGTNHYFINNYWQFTPNVEKEYDANGLSAISNHGGDWVSVNNIFVKNNWQGNANVYHFYAPNLYPNLWYRNWAKVLVANNTSIAYMARHFVVDCDTQAVIKNNIMWIPDEFHNGSSAGSVHFISPNPDDPVHSVDDYVIKNNVMIDNSQYANSRVYLGGANVPPMDPSNQFIQDPTDAITPGFVNFFYGNTDPQQFQLQSTSICRDAGESNITFTMHPDNDPAALNYLGSGDNLVNYYLKRDWNGNLRDSQWDVGAFEYVN